MWKYVDSITMSVKERRHNYEFKEKLYELVPPDGGWGYLVSVAAVINFSSTTAFAASFGMLYNDFIIETGMNSASVTLLSGIFCMSIAIAAFFTSPLLTIMTKRKLAFAASVIYSLGCFGTIIMKSPLFFNITQGIMQGAGLGILYNLSSTLLNEYFLNKKVLIMNFVQTATGLLTMIAPIFVKWSLEEFGSRGTLLLIGGLSLHNFFAASIMQPVQWHMKKVDVPEKELLLEEYKDKTVEEYKLKEETTVFKLPDLEGTITKSAIVEALELAEEDKKKSAVRKVMESLIDPSLCKTFLLSCASLGPAMCSAADGVHVILTPPYLYSMGWSQENVAMAITLYGFGDLAMRAIFTFVSKWMIKLGTQEIYIIGVAIAIISRIGMLWSSSVTAMMICFTMMGVAHCSIAVLTPLVISDCVAPEKFSSAMGVCLLLVGLWNIGLGPVVGAVRDVTNSYTNAFCALISFYAIVVILWPIELIIKKQRRKATKTISQPSKLNKVPK